MNAAKKVILALWLVVASLATASAAIPDASENRARDFSSTASETLPAEALEVVGTHRENTPAAYDFVSGFCLAAEGTAAEARGGVYLLRDAEGNVVRTGRTNDLLRREAEHARDPVLKDYEFEPVYRTDVYEEQRGLEQLLHDTYNPPLNKVRPISPSNPNLQKYLDAAQNYLGK